MNTVAAMPSTNSISEAVRRMPWKTSALNGCAMIASDARWDAGTFEAFWLAATYDWSERATRFVSAMASAGVVPESRDPNQRQRPARVVLERGDLVVEFALSRRVDEPAYGVAIGELSVDSGKVLGRPGLIRRGRCADRAGRDAALRDEQRRVGDVHLRRAERDAGRRHPNEGERSQRERDDEGR